MRNHIYRMKGMRLAPARGTGVRILFICTVTLLCAGQAVAQTIGDSLVTWFDNYRVQHYQEKIFVHTSQSDYVTGETFWCRAYLTDAHAHLPSNLSKVAYLEMTDYQGKPVWQTSMRIDSGAGNASWQIPNTLPTGNYLLRAYTRWMRNDEPGYFFRKELFILNPGRKPQSSGNREDSIFLQAYPEGGNLVEGLENRISFHLHDAAGRGIDRDVFLIRDKKDTLAKTRPEKFGMGEFVFVPEAGHRYVLRVADGTTGPVDFSLPGILSKGYAMRMDPSDGGMLEIRVRLGTGMTDPGCYLFVHCRQTMPRAFYAPFGNGEAIFRIRRDQLGEGISQFTVFNAGRMPVCERLYFKPPSRRLSFTISSTGNEYAKRSPVEWDVKSRIEGGVERAAGFSAAVIRVPDSLAEQESDILSYLYLESDIGGFIENPSYYFTADTLQRGKQADLLMRTRGWRRFRWEDVLRNRKEAVAYLPEYSGPLVDARVQGKTGKTPLAGQYLTVTVPGTRYLFGINKSDGNGNVTIPLERREGSGELVIQVAGTGTDTMQVIPVSPFDSSVARAPAISVHKDEKSMKFMEEEMLDAQLSQAFGLSQAGGIRAFEQEDTTDFFGSPDHEYRLDDYVRFGSMEEVLREYVREVDVRKERKDYHLLVTNEPANSLFREDPLVLLDGIPVNDMNRVMRIDPLKIKRIGVVSRRYNLGGQNLPGIISLHTYEGKLEGFELPPELLVTDYQGLQVMREFASVAYPSPQNDHTPDLRHLLYWLPDGKTVTGAVTPIRFFSSDVPGIYAIIIQGMDNEGRAGSAVRFFEVK